MRERRRGLNWSTDFDWRSFDPDQNNKKTFVSVNKDSWVLLINLLKIFFIFDCCIKPSTTSITLWPPAETESLFSPCSCGFYPTNQTHAGQINAAKSWFYSTLNRLSFLFGWSSSEAWGSSSCRNQNHLKNRGCWPRHGHGSWDVCIAEFMESSWRNELHAPDCSAPTLLCNKCWDNWIMFCFEITSAFSPSPSWTWTPARINNLNRFHSRRFCVDPGAVLLKRWWWTNRWAMNHWSVYDQAKTCCNLLLLL